MGYHPSWFSKNKKPLRKRVTEIVVSSGYRAKKRGLVSNLTTAEFWEILMATEGVCPICKRNVGFYEFVIDHILPISKGGEHTKSNVQAICYDCNGKKGSFPDHLRNEGWVRQWEAAEILGTYPAKIVKLFRHKEGRTVCELFPSAIHITEVEQLQERFRGMNLTQFANHVNARLKEQGLEPMTTAGIRYRLYPIITEQRTPLTWTDVQSTIDGEVFWDIQREHLDLLTEAVINFEVKPYDQREGIGQSKAE